MQLGPHPPQLLDVHQLDPPAVHGRRQPPVEPGARYVDLPLHEGGGGPEPVPPVDRVLGGDQRGERVAARLGRGELGGHHPGQQALAAVGGQHAHAGDRGGADGRPAGHGQLLREGAQGGHAATAVGVERPLHPGEVAVLGAQGYVGLGHPRGGQETGVHGAHPVGEFGFGDRPDVSTHSRPR